MSFRPVSLIGFVALFLLQSSFSNAQDAVDTREARGITLGDIRQAEVAMVNITAGPGLEGVTQELNQPGRRSDYLRSSFGGSFDYTIKNYIFNGFLGGALLHGRLNDSFDVTLPAGDNINLTADRTLSGLRASAGLVFPYNAYWKIRPYFSLIVSDLGTKTSLSELPAEVRAQVAERVEYLSVQAQAWSGVASVEFDYHRWFDEVRIESLTHINISRTNTFSSDTPSLDQSASSATLLFKANASRQIGRGFWGRPFTGRINYSYTDYMNQPKAALGFTQLHEAGLGADWHIRIKPLDLFNIYAIGVKASYVRGDGVEGYNIGFTMR